MIRACTIITDQGPSKSRAIRSGSPLDHPERRAAGRGLVGAHVESIQQQHLAPDLARHGEAGEAGPDDDRVTRSGAHRHLPS